MPKLSVILATDTYQTIRPVIDRLRAQTSRAEIELVLVAPSTDAMSPVMAFRDEFAAITVVEDPVKDLAMARAVGIRAAAAKFVFVGETHSYAQPGFAEAFSRHYSGPWTVLTPAFGNANPKPGLSWAGFLSDYGGWVEGMPSGEIIRIPIYNTAFRRDALLSLGDRLAPALSQGDELLIALRDGGHKAYFEPAALLTHVNVAPLSHWVKERFAAGVVIASNRARRWSTARRVFYAAASPLIPFVLCWRVVPGVWSTVRQKRLPLSIVFWIVVGMIVKSAGEFAGYVGVPPMHWDRMMHEYEVHKLSYAGPGPS
ncbi:MAG: hypothetical protein ABI972_21535 [Acidobacteriota bacterium]